MGTMAFHVATTRSVALGFIVFLLRRDDLLDLDVRRRIFRHVQAYPGLHLREIARALRLEVNHAKYHLGYLEKHGLVSSRRDEAYLRFFPREKGSLGLREVMNPRDKALLALLRRPIPLRVTLVLLDRLEASQSEILKRVRVAHGTIHYHLQKMEVGGLVASHREGRERRYRLRDPTQVLGHLVRYRPPDELVRGFLEAWEEVELV